MNLLIRLPIWAFFLGCSTATTPKTDSGSELISGLNDTLEYKSDPFQNEHFPDAKPALSQAGLPQTLINKLGTYWDAFVEENLSDYDCESIDQYYEEYGTKLNTSHLAQIDSVTCGRLFGLYKNRHGYFCYCYFYSKDQPINGFYPITVIQQFGVVDRPLVMVLFDESGELRNSVEVANAYGELGGCLSSQRINDSTLIQELSIPEFWIDSVTGEDTWETEIVRTQITIHATGEISETELERSRQVDE